MYNNEKEQASLANIEKEETYNEKKKTSLTNIEKEEGYNEKEETLVIKVEKTEVSRGKEKTSLTEVEKRNFSKGILLWSLILIAYFVFIFNWMVMDSMGGSVGDGIGWIDEFFGDNGKEPPVLLTQSVNYTITFMRGLGAFLAGWVLVKIGHRKSIYIAMGSLLFGIIAPWVQFYSLFVISRMIMAIGGTTLIVYTQPIIANYFTKSETKSRLNVFNCFACNFGLIFAIAPFIFWSHGLTLHWQAYSTGFATLAIVSLVLYVIYGEDINLDTTQGPEDTNVTYKSVLKEKRTWIFSIAYVFWLTNMLLIMTMVTKYFILPFNPWFATKISDVGYGGYWAISLWKVVFLLGIIPGVFAFRFVTRGTYSRKPIICTVLVVGLTAMLISVLLAGLTGTVEGAGDEAVYGTSVVGLVFSMLFIFFAGTCLWGMQGIILGWTYEYKGATPKKQGILLGFIWGITYMGVTILTIIMASLIEIGTIEGESAIGVGNNNTGEILGCLFFFAFSFLSPVVLLFAEETHKGNNFFKVKYNALKDKISS